jgi:3-methyladenine DNA glycosylase Tag
MTATPPPESGLPSGVAPEAIRDPAVRAAYENQIAANQAKLKAYGFQSKLNDALQECTEMFEDNVTQQYPRSSERDLATVIDSTVRSKVLGASLKARVSAIFAGRR